MKRFVNVHKGEATAGRGEVILKSDIRDRSCFAIVARDPMHKIGAIAHAMFLHSVHKEKTDPILAKDARESIDKMISNMTLLGAASDDIEVSLVAGENVDHQKDDFEYDEEVDRIFNILKERRIRCREVSAVDVGHKHVMLDVETGDISYA
ncbi:MAG: hypothetical protein PHY73_01465 [Candidatus Omnitrophica bacterium]|nr:hypothetical protein [Candidatus Omnitrophota bacterium]